MSASVLNRPASLGRYGPRGVETRSLHPPVSNGNDPDDVPPASVGDDVASGGDPNGVEITGGFGPWHQTHIVPSPWDGWPDDWATPLWGGTHAVDRLADTAWGCLDLNSSVLASMPPYLVNARAGLPCAWLENPDPDIYASWAEFAKALMWDYGTAEAFVLATARYDQGRGRPARFHVVEPWLVNVELDGGLRRYRIGALEVTDDILHIRYKSTASTARGVGPLEAAGARMTAARVLLRYLVNFVKQGGVPHTVLKFGQELTALQADNALHQWAMARMAHLGLAGLVSGDVEVEAMQVNPRDASMLEVSQFTEARIAFMLGVPPFLAALPSGGDSMTYTNATGLFDFHWRAGLRPKAAAVMAALSGWLLPHGTRVELNRDEYVQPGPKERAETWKILNEIADDTGRVMTAEQIKHAERLDDASEASLIGSGAL